MAMAACALVGLALLPALKPLMPSTGLPGRPTVAQAALLAPVGESKASGPQPTDVHTDFGPLGVLATAPNSLTWKLLYKESAWDTGTAAAPKSPLVLGDFASAAACEEALEQRYGRLLAVLPFASGAQTPPVVEKRAGHFHWETRGLGGQRSYTAWCEAPP